MNFKKGTLIPIGGNEDKGIEENDRHKLDFIGQGILHRVVKESGGIEANIVVIPSASSIPVEVGENYLYAFDTLGCKNVIVLDIRSKKDAETAHAIEQISKANCVMFSGGDQSKIVKRIGGTKIHEILKNRYQNEENFVIAGTSAGAMAMASEMISGGSAKESFFKGAVFMNKGLGLIEHLTIDTHFIQRGRFGRLAEAVAKFPHIIGIGLAEDTGLVIKDNLAEVIGSGMVIIFDGRKLKHNNEKILKQGTPMSLTHLRAHILANGDRFNIKKKKVKVLPLEEPFNYK
ncbi:MAG: cyanophycinase [Bacteroidetes bacterium]|nr:MAG: cyanophycinase [Bacteroidota bacterium]MBL1144486.1 cyanophycinase [Bacteroidota bacterium]MCB0803604.1 cyanophycinase [Flavobacteriales bacterium]NOG57281.1 cyanophycinase [Bacteroidota bacterium]